MESPHNRIRRWLSRLVLNWKAVRSLRRSTLFWSGWYLSMYPETARKGWGGAVSYVYGSKNGPQWPSPLFNPSLYLAANPDVAENGVDPFIHYVVYGQKEGRRTNLERTGTPADSLWLMGMIEGSALGSLPNPDELHQLAVSAMDSHVDVLCFRLPVTLPALASFRSILRDLGPKGIKACLRIVSPEIAFLEEEIPALAHSLAMLLADHGYLSSRHRPLLISSDPWLRKSGLLPKLDETLREYGTHSPLHFLEVSPTRPADGILADSWFEGICECLAPSAIPEYRPYENPTGPSQVSCPALIQCFMAPVVPLRCPTIPALVLQWPKETEAMRRYGPIRYVSDGLMTRWARSCAGTALDEGAPRIVAIPHWESSAGTAETRRSQTEQCRDMAELMRATEADWNWVKPTFKTGPEYEGALLAKFEGPPKKPVLIFQIGKVGSTSVYEPLQHLYDEQVFHLHALNNIEASVRMLRQRGTFDQFTIDHFTMCKEVRDWMELATDETEFKVITMVRDPVARTVSSFFHMMFDVRRNFEDDWSSGTLTSGELRELFLRFALDTNVDAWWRSQFEPIFGVDVFSLQFPFAQGYMQFKAKQASVLLIRTEDLDRVGEAAISEFLGIQFKFEGTRNKTEERGIPAEMERELKSAPLPVPAVERLLNTQTAAVFYTPAELARSAEKWLGETGAASFAAKKKP